jgi:peptidyl-prolyl cis-trans isomerase SurA
LVVTPLRDVTSARPAQTIDRVVASIGDRAITQSDVVQEYRFETFVNDGRVPRRPPPSGLLGKVEARLVDQELLTEQLRDFPVDPSSVREKAADELNAIRKRFRSVERYRAALSSLGLSEPQVLSRLEIQQRILMMVDERTRPAAAVEPQDIEDYYRKTFLPQLAKTTKGKPPLLSEVEDRIREILIQQKMNQLLEEWLTELRREQHVQILGS